MNCADCKARREMAMDAFFNDSMAAALRQVGIGIAEAVGVKEKTGAAELEKVEQTKAERKAEAAKAGAK